MSKSMIHNRPPLPPNPPTDEELEARDRHIASRIVAMLSRGNAGLRQGRYMTSEDLEREKRRVFGKG